ncbi:MAG: dienelactone hydrolase family protein [Candidatus Thiodiazotropha sp. (ex Ctena orbiculata)]|uniref:Dienelactone hydrolase family protein n=1 Tax=Candidatus Thiodiazotropha taylori TaxID=2792791 RepID=A0A944MBE6_9GAMM|nr:dienelactone hydrolase family protein [Candidatus Thiodiazotropha taylori]MBT2990876.1 dienelactone hydrolase family protein [Candidatus Thiodiazotropha taylori]MBT2996562.1 dienelactone hydrolase family protein [Candidatus Thiodiazotropha taylori]MBT3000602.1 dienelactone hydrolase family protein [Candidatus Thiodiazotropha taylori]MBT3026821.1 dienelactone hydrolase family protein [Candidatus Thiodiazotropha taylori]
MRVITRAVFFCCICLLTVLMLSSTHGQTTTKSTAPAIASDTVVGRMLEAPVNTRPLSEKFWWDEAWYDNGVLQAPVNYDVIERKVVYVNPSDNTEVPAIVYRPKQPGKYPGVLFQHGRRGLDELVQRLPRRMAARGFVVLAPDVYSARFIDKLPIAHMVETEGDTNAGVDYLLAQPDVSTSKICLYSHTRGGYYALQVAVKFNRQNQEVACYVSFYPHWQNPNAEEPMQVYRYAVEADSLEIPTMILIGEYEQYQRRRSIETAVKSMKEAGKNVHLIIYPGVGRGFDFRPERVRTFADDLATKDATMRVAEFMRRHLSSWEK